MKLKLISVLLLVLQLTSSPVAPFNWFGIRTDPFEMLQSYLAANEASEDAHANLQLINELIATKPESIKDKSHWEALRSFAPLININETNICSPESLKLLVKAVKVMRQYTKNPLEDHRIQERPIRIVIELLKQNAVQCFRVNYFNWGPKRIDFQLDLPNHEVYSVVFGIDRGFGRLNDFLTNKVHSMDALENLRAVDELYALYRGFGLEHDSYLEAMRQFSALRALLKPGQCSRDNSKLAADFLASLRIWAPNPFNGPEAKAKLAQLVRVLLKERGATCMRQFALEWQKKKPRAVEQLRAVLFDLSDRLIDASDCKFTEKFAQQRNEDLNCVVRRSRADLTLFHGPTGSPSTHATAEELLAIVHSAQAANVHDGRHLGSSFNQRTLTRELEQLLIKPCKSLIDHRSSVLLMKSFDTARSVHLTDFFFRLTGNYDIQMKDPINELIDWTTFYGVCKRLTETNRERMIADLISIFSSPHPDQ